MDITITITGSTNNPGNYNISGTTSLGVTTQLATNVTGNTQTGFSVTLYNVDSSTTGITVASTGTCSTTQTYTFIVPTPTPTVTPTATLIPLYQVDIRQGNAGDCSTVPSACSDYYSIGPNYTIYTASGGIGVSGEIAYADALGDTIFVGGPGPGYYYSDGVDGSRISNVGVISPYISCNC